jgi:hypothetical protein
MSANSIDQLEPIAHGIVDVTTSSPGYGLIGTNLYFRRTQSFEKIVVLIDDERGVSLRRWSEVRVYAEMHHRVIASIPTPPSRGQHRRLLQRAKAEQTDVELVATLLFAGRNGELHVIEEPPHQNLRKIAANKNLVRFSEPWDHSLRSAASECARKSTKRC